MAYDPSGRWIPDHEHPDNQISSEYKAYINSPQWKALRASLIQQRGGCQGCGKTHSLQVHHVTYERLGREEPEDLEVLCVDCHKKADEQRRFDAEEDRWDRRVDAYATKRWGKYWQRTYTRRHAERELGDYLDSIGEEW